MNRTLLIVSALFLAAGCGEVEEKTGVIPTNSNNGNIATNASTSNNLAANNTMSNGTTVDETVQIECVSDLVTAGGNYYAVTAEITAGEARVELINFLAATPTSDPVEMTIWNDAVAAQFSPVVFAYQTEEHFLEVTKAEDEVYYRGTMSGESEFAEQVNVTCWSVSYQPPASYDAETGNCVDEAGEPAFNDIPWMVALRTGFGQCTSFEGELAGETNGATFDFIDLRGSSFNFAALRNAYVERVQMEGADLRNITLESAVISGTMDQYTQLPDGGCDTDGQTFSCFN